MDKIIRNRNSDIKLSLHDAHINKITCKEDSILFDFNYIFDYSTGEEETVNASILFEGVDPEYIYIYIIKENYKKEVGKIKGKRYSLCDYIKKNPHVDLEVITETYNGYFTVWTGYSHNKKKTRKFFIEISGDGDMIYNIGEK